MLTNHSPQLDAGDPHASSLLSPPESPINGSFPLPTAAERKLQPIRFSALKRSLDMFKVGGLMDALHDIASDSHPCKVSYRRIRGEDISSVDIKMKFPVRIPRHATSKSEGGSFDMSDMLAAIPAMSTEIAWQYTQAHVEAPDYAFNGTRFTPRVSHEVRMIKRAVDIASTASEPVDTLRVRSVRSKAARSKPY